MGVNEVRDGQKFLFHPQSSFVYMRRGQDIYVDYYGSISSKGGSPEKRVKEYREKFRGFGHSFEMNCPEYFSQRVPRKVLTL